MNRYPFVIVVLGKRLLWDHRAVTQTAPPGVMAQLSEMISKHPLLSGLIPVGLAALKVIVVSGGDPQTLRALMQDLDVLALVLATFLPIGSTMFVWGYAFWAWAGFKLLGYPFKERPTPDQQSHMSRVVVVFPIVCVVVFWAMPVAFLIANAVIVLILVGIGLLHRIRRDAGPSAVLLVVSGFTFVGLVAAVIIYPLISGMWLPEERITVRGYAPDTGYVLFSDVRWTRYMDEDRRIVIVPSPSVLTRTTVESSVWFHQTLKTVVF